MTFLDIVAPGRISGPVAAFAQMERPMPITRMKAFHKPHSEYLGYHSKLRRLDTLHEFDLIRKAKYLHPPS